MTEASPSRPQFNLRRLMLWVLILSVILALASQFPRVTLPLLIFAFWFPLPYAPLAMVFLWQDRQGGESRSEPLLRSLGAAWLDGWKRQLALSFRPEPPDLYMSLLIAFLSSSSVIIFWMIVREYGQTLAMVVDATVELPPNAVSNQLLVVFTDGLEPWIYLAKWEAWSLARWWLLFGSLTAVWLGASAAIRSVTRTSSNESAQESVTVTVRRFLVFAPWLVLLEVLHLVGVWIYRGANIVPEPGTLFVVAVFSWDLWNWGVWRDELWLVRALLPSAVVSAAYSRSVLRWPWIAAVVGGLLLAPAAITLSIAWSVLYSSLR